MTRSSSAGFARFLLPLLAAGLLLCVPPAPADAASWQWSRIPGRERVTVLLDAPDRQAAARRTARQSLDIHTAPQRGLTGSGTPPEAGALVTGLRMADGVLRLHTSTPAFGFIATRPAPDRIVLDIFSDPLGARWQPDGGLAPAAPLPSAAAMAPPAGSPQPQTAPVPAAAARTEPGAGSGPISPAPPTRSADAAAPSPSATMRRQEAASVPETPRTPPAGTTTENSPAAPAALSASPPPGSPARPDASPAASIAQSASLPSSDRNSTPAPPPAASAASAPASAPDSPEMRSDSLPEETANIPDAAPQVPATAESAPEHASLPSPAASASGVSRPTEPTGLAVAPPPAAPKIPEIHARLNMQGPEAWPESRALSSSSFAPSAQAEAFPPRDGTRPSSMVENAVPPAPGTLSPVSPAPGTAAEENRFPTQSGQITTQAPHHVAEATPPAPSGQEQKAGSAGEGTAEEALPPRYVDEEGNPVPPPPDVPALLAQMRDAIKNGRYQDAIEPMGVLHGVELGHKEREELLYNIMTALYENSRPNVSEHSQRIIAAANEAMNFNQGSPRVPEALAVLARVNLVLGNVEDALGYAHLMRRKYPGDVNVPAIFLELGEKQMGRQEYAEATLSFQTILQEYPESKMAKDAARLQTYALYKQGHMDRALTLLDFVERRWPRIYLEAPDYLSVAADIRFRQGRLEEALRTYWVQYNIEPTKPESATTLYHIAETYYLLRDPDAAANVLTELARAFPDSAEAPRALLRLGENGIHDGNPTVDELFALFEQPNPRLPGLYYQRILKEYPDSPEAVTAQLRTIAWQLWNKEYMPSMVSARSFMIDYEDRPEFLRARTILLRGFAHELGNSLQEENYERVLKLWDDFPQVQDEYLPLEPDLRMALARAYLNRGEQARGMELLAPFLDEPGDSDYDQYAYNLYLATYLRTQNWDGILTLGEKVAAWKLPPEARDQLDYAMALSAENLELPGRALPLWQKIAPKQDIPLYQRAYASYFLARDAERRQDLRAAYQYNLDTLGMFTQLQDEQSPYADSERVRESIAALMDVTEIAGRYAESLEWANKYAVFVPETSPDYAGLRFREARLHRKMGDMARWRAILQGIVDKEPESVFGKMAASELHTQDVARDLTRFTGQ